MLSLLAGLAFFATVRRSAGARSALYALLLYSVAPLSVVLGQQFSPAALILAAQSWTVLALVRWRMVADAHSVAHARPTGTALPFAVVVLSGLFLGLVDPGAVFLTLPCIYIVIAPRALEESLPRGSALITWREAWAKSPYRGQAVVVVSAIVGSSVLWWAFSQGSDGALLLSLGDGGGGIGAIVSALLNGGTYVQVVGLLVERVLTLLGLLLLGAGLLNGARPPVQLLFHAWLASGVLHVLLDAYRLPGHSEVLLPLNNACVRVGRYWRGMGRCAARAPMARPARAERDQEADFAVSPHTAWLLDLPKERADLQKSSRPQAQLALSKSVAQRSRTEPGKMDRTVLLVLGTLSYLRVPAF